MTDIDKLSFKKLDVDNYAIWEPKMKSVLTIKDCIEAISDANSAKSDKARAMITLCVEDFHLSSIYLSQRDIDEKRDTHTTAFFNATCPAPTAQVKIHQSRRPAPADFTVCPVL